MSQEHDDLLQIQQISNLKPRHFADLIRAAQLIFDPTAGIPGSYVVVDWQEFGIPDEVELNLKLLGQKYQYACPNIPDAIIWSQLTPATRNWFLENKDELWKFEEAFPPLDED
ncbi:hypothetical protein NIES2109_34410 [Nostoc sp. HK-01]|nr:hypothetical protein NIES2109_34410 [Nostoc sp. HK-01]